MIAAGAMKPSIARTIRNSSYLLEAVKPLAQPLRDNRPAALVTHKQPRACVIWNSQVARFSGFGYFMPDCYFTRFQVNLVPGESFELFGFDAAIHGKNQIAKQLKFGICLMCRIEKGRALGDRQNTWQFFIRLGLIDSLKWTGRAKPALCCASIKRLAASLDLNCWKVVRLNQAKGHSTRNDMEPPALVRCL